MGYELGEVHSQDELNAIVEVIWAAMDGVDPSHPIFHPVLQDDDGSGDESDAVKRAIAQTKTRLWIENTSDPSIHWIFIRDGSSSGGDDGSSKDIDGGEGGRGDIVAGCQWRFYEKNPFPDGVPRIIADWWPEGVGRDFATEVVNQCFRIRCTTMARPHAGLSTMCVRPDYQRRGLGKMLLDWGLRRADQLRIEIFIEATPQGRHLYETCGGFRPVREVHIELSRTAQVGGGNGSDGGQSVRETAEWAELERAYLPLGFTAMWRPVGGVWRPGEPQQTFEPRLRMYDESFS